MLEDRSPQNRAHALLGDGERPFASAARLDYGVWPAQRSRARSRWDTCRPRSRRERRPQSPHMKLAIRVSCVGSMRSEILTAGPSPAPTPTILLGRGIG